MRWNRASWVSLRPNGIGLQKPNHYGDMAKIAWEQRRHPKLAWDILSKGVCDGCALGVAGFHDWTIDGVHLCTTRLRLLSLNTADAIDDRVLANVASLRGRDGAQLRSLGRLAHPMRRRAGDAGFTRISWEDAYASIAARWDGDRTAIFLTSRGVTNETYYVCGKAARALGVSSVDSAARVCHAPSTVALKETIGAAATTCSFVDVVESDLIVLIGANPATNQPVFMKYLYEAKRTGTKVVVVNPYLEPGLEHYWVPSSPESALFGTKICDLHVPVTPGGDVALFNAVLKELIRRGAVDESFVRERTTGWDELATWLATKSLDQLVEDSGVPRGVFDAFVDLYASSRTAILVWSMGITQRKESVAGVKAIVNVGLARGNVGRDGAGLMPIRGHSGVQGGAEMGAYSTALPGGASVTPEAAAALGEQWGFEVPSSPGLTAPAMVEAAERGDLDVLYLAGGSFLDVMPEPLRVRAALEHVPLRVHQDIVLTEQMLLDPPEGGEVVLLPAATRYEQEGGGTETTTERRIAYSPPIAVGRIGEAKSEWRIFAELAARVRPDLAGCFAWRTGDELRAEIARIVPLYAGIETLRKTGDSVQYGGRHLPITKAVFSVVDVAPPALGPDEFEVTTRRGKQFNSIVQGAVDPLNGARRDDIFISHRDANRLGLRDGDAIVLRSSVGSMRGRVRREKLPRGSIQVHWPEGNVLIESGADHREPLSNVPAYTAVVTLERVGPAT